MASRPVSVKDIYIAHIYQARCKYPDCEWSSELFGAYSEAKAEKKDHLASHRTLMTVFAEEASDG